MIGLNMASWKHLLRRGVNRGLYSQELGRKKRNKNSLIEHAQLERLEDRTLLSSVSVFDNGNYVDTAGSSGSYRSESDNIQASLTQLGHSVSTFTGTSASAINSAVAGKDAFVIPELERGDLHPDLDSSARSAIRSYVGNGGTLVVSGTSNGNTSDLLDAVFGWSTSESYGNGSASKQSAAAGTTFSDDASTLGIPSATMDLSGLPAGSSTIYSDGSGARVAVIPYGSGHVIYLGWDWFNAEPNGSVDSGWLGVLDSAVEFQNNTAPALQDLRLEASSVNEGSTAYLRGTIVDPDSNDSFTIQINWGDGSPHQTVSLSPSSRNFQIPHTYTDDAPSNTSSDPVTVRVLSLTDGRDTADLFQSGSRTISLNGDVSSTDFNDATSATFTPFRTNRITLSTSGYAHSHGGTVSTFVDIYNPSTNT